MAEKQVKIKIDILPFDKTGYNLGSSGDDAYPWDNIYANNLKVGNVNISGALTVAGDSINFGDLIINGPKDADKPENQGLLYSAKSHSLLYDGTSPSSESDSKPFILLDNSEYAEDGGDAVFHVLAKIKDSQNKYWMLGVVGNGTNRPSAFAIVNSDTGLDASATKNKFFFTSDGMLTLDKITTKEIVCNTDVKITSNVFKIFSSTEVENVRMTGAGTIYARSLHIKGAGEDIKDGTSLASISSDGAIKCTALTSSGAISCSSLTTANSNGAVSCDSFYSSSSHSLAWGGTTSNTESKKAFITLDYKLTNTASAEYQVLAKLKDGNNNYWMLGVHGDKNMPSSFTIDHTDNTSNRFIFTPDGGLTLNKIIVRSDSYGPLSNRPAASSAVTGQVYFVTA